MIVTTSNRGPQKKVYARCTCALDRHRRHQIGDPIGDFEIFRFGLASFFNRGSDAGEGFDCFIEIATHSPHKRIRLASVCGGS